MDLRTFHELPAPDMSGKPDPAREGTRDACLSELRRCLIEGMAETVTAKCAESTMRCNACGHVEDFDRGPLEHTCSGCGVTWDQDVNGARNLRDSASVAVVTQ